MLSFLFYSFRYFLVICSFLFLFYVHYYYYLFSVRMFLFSVRGIVYCVSSLCTHCLLAPRNRDTNIVAWVIGSLYFHIH